MSEDLSPAMKVLCVVAALMIVALGSTWLFEQLIVSAVLTTLLVGLGLSGVVLVVARFVLSQSAQ